MPEGPSSSAAPVSTLADLSEEELLARIVPRLPRGSVESVPVGPGDDTAVVRCDAAQAADESGQGLGTLGHWIAVSGAAAAPGAGSYTSTGWALVMFLLGIRLGHWMPAPLWQPGATRRLTAWLWRRAPKPLMLWAEASATFHGQARPWW